MKIIPVFLLSILTLLTPALFAGAKGAAYVNDLGRLDNDSYQRIADSPEVGYVMVQVNPGQKADKETKRIAELAKKGKKIILQVFWGPGGRYNWSYHSLVALPFEKDPAKDLFEGIDKVIEIIDPQNIYAIHLMEENGWFGIDIEKAGDWRMNKYGIVDGYEDKCVYNNWHNSKDCKWTPFVPNIKRQEKAFAKMTGLNLAKAPCWTAKEKYVFKRWCRQVSALAEKTFFEHIRKKYPNIKCYTWHGIRTISDQLCNSDTTIINKAVDGVIINPYGSTRTKYNSYGNSTILYPGKEKVSLSWGGFDSLEFKREKLVLAYLTECTIIGFYEGSPFYGGVGDGKFKQYYPGESRMDYIIPEIWKHNTALMKEYNSLPDFRRKNSKILLIATATGRYFDGVYSFRDFKSYDLIPAGNENRADLSKYALVIAHKESTFSNHDIWKKYNVPGNGFDNKKMEEYVKNGGILFVSGVVIPKDKDLFLNRFFNMSGASRRVSLTYKPATPLKKELGLGGTYDLKGRKLAVSVVDKNGVQNDGLGYLAHYGKGLIYLLPFYLSFKIDEKAQADYKRLLRDISYGLLKYHGAEKIAEKYICPPGYRYFEVENKEKNIKCYIWIEGPEIKVSGVELMTGDKDPVFGPKRRAGVVKVSKVSKVSK